MLRLKILYLFSLFSFFLNGQVDDMSYKIVNDIRTNFNSVEFISSEAFELIFEDSRIKKDFVNDCKKQIPQNELTKLLQKKVKSFSWDNSKLIGIKVISFDSLLKFNEVTATTNYIINVSAPLIDDKKEFAVVRIFYQYPSYEMGGGICYYLFRYINKKWTEVNRDQCIDY